MTRDELLNIRDVVKRGMESGEGWCFFCSSLGECSPGCEAATALAVLDRETGLAPLPAGDRGPWILSSTGRQLYLFDLRPEDIYLADIAHSLSSICRFNGHCQSFYSVAQHSVLVARHVAPEHQLAALLHDATEAYCGDVVRPLKRALPAYQEMEARIWAAVAARFGLAEELPEEVLVADTRMLQTERRDLLPPHPWAWTEDQIADGAALPYPEPITTLSPAEAKEEFLSALAVIAMRSPDRPPYAPLPAVCPIPEGGENRG